MHFSRSFYLNFQVYWPKVIYLIHLFNFCRNCSDVLCCLSDVGYFLSFFCITLPRFIFSKNQVQLCRYFRFLVSSCLPLCLLFLSFYFLWAQFSILFLIFLVEYSAHWSPACLLYVSWVEDLFGISLDRWNFHFHSVQNIFCFASKKFSSLTLFRSTLFNFQLLGGIFYLSFAINF